MATSTKAPYTGPIPKPTPESQPFWSATKEHKLALQHCNDCGQFYFYPRPLCRHCLSRNVEWRQVSGTGKLHSFVINSRPPRSFPIQEPFIIGIVELDEGPRLMTNIIGIEADPKRLRCEMPVQVVFEDITEEITLPKFKPLT